MKTEPLTPALFSQRLKSGTYEKIGNVRKALGKVKGWTDEQKEVAVRAAEKFFGVKGQPKAAPKKAAPKAVKKAAAPKKGAAPKTTITKVAKSVKISVAPKTEDSLDQDLRLLEVLTRSAQIDINHPLVEQGQIKALLDKVGNRLGLMPKVKTSAAVKAAARASADPTVEHVPAITEEDTAQPNGIDCGPFAEAAKKAVAAQTAS